MGTSLGYTQGMQYQFPDAPQPSLPQLRQARLQQLREERMRRQQRRMNPDTTTFFRRKGSKRSGESSPPSNMPPEMSPSLLSGSPGASAQPAQMSPLIQVPPAEVSPIRSSTAPPQNMQRSPATYPVGAGSANQLQSAAESAQDTGMIQKARIGQATLILTGSFIVSRVLGLLRTSMFAYVFGASATSDAFIQAFLIPDFIFNIVAGGALGSAFIPVFVKYIESDRDEKTAWHVTSSALNLAIAIMMGLAVLTMIFARQIVPLYNPAVHDPKQLDLIASLTRIMLLQPIALGAGVIVTAVLQARQNFLLPAIGTVLYNIGLIAGLIPGLILSIHRSEANSTIAVYAATIGVVLGALLQVGIQLPGLSKIRMHYTFSFDWRHVGVIQIARQMVPRMINATMLFASTFVDRTLIQLLVAVVGTAAINGLVTQYYQAFQLLLLPLGIFGMSVATAAFPTMAENVARGRMDRFSAIIMDTLRSILFLSIPSSVGLIVLGLPIIQVLLQHGAYTLDEAQSTAVPLAFFALGLTGLASVEILTRSFYALRDSTTPVIVSIAQFILKIALSLLLINVAVFGSSATGGALGMGALAFSTSIAGLLEAGVLFWLLHERVEGLQPGTLVAFLGRVLAASLAMGLGLIVIRFILDRILVTTAPHQLLGIGGTLVAFIKLLIELAAGVLIYFRATHWLDIEEFWKQGPVKRLLDRFKLSWL